MFTELCKKIKKKYLDLKIRTKLLTFYSAVMIFSVILSCFICGKIYNNALSAKVSEVSAQTLSSISSNIFSMIENAKNLSKVIIASNEIQYSLRSINESPASSGAAFHQTINSHISKFIEAFPFVSSIYIFDSGGRRYGADKNHLMSLKVGSIKEAGWYQAAVDKRGGFILRLNAGGIYENLSGGKYISLIRIINDIYTQKPIGILIMNITENSFAESYRDILEEYGTDIMILDENGQTVIDFRSGAFEGIG